MLTLGNQNTRLQWGHRQGPPKSTAGLWEDIPWFVPLSSISPHVLQQGVCVAQNLVFRVPSHRHCQEKIHTHNIQGVIRNTGAVPVRNMKVETRYLNENFVSDFQDVFPQKRGHIPLPPKCRRLAIQIVEGFWHGEQRAPL